MMSIRRWDGKHLVECRSPSEVFTGALVPALSHHYTPTLCISSVLESNDCTLCR